MLTIDRAGPLAVLDSGAPSDVADGSVHADHDLLAINEQPGKVEARRIRPRGRAPPAAFNASTTREPAGSSMIPGRRTLPVTSMTSVPATV